MADPKSSEPADGAKSKGNGATADAPGPAPARPAGAELQGFAKRAWGEPLMRLDRTWTRLESRLCAWVLIAEIIALCVWIALKGLSAEYQAGDAGGKNVSGVVFRSLISAAILGLVANKLLRPRVAESHPTFEAVKRRQRIVVTSAVILGLLAGRLWANTGVAYFSNLLNWMQNASLLMLIGGLRGVATRLTLWLALLGASIATAKGKHINIDVVMRFLTPKVRVPVAVLGWVAAAVMCTAGAWGFVDHIAIALFHAPPSEVCKDDPSKECRVSGADKLAHVGQAMSTDLFLIGRQLSLDVRSLPRVLFGTTYNEYFRTADWNDWIKEGGWTEHFTKDQVDGLYAATDSGRGRDFHAPAVSIPGGEEVRGILIKDADFIFPFGMLMIALRFVLRALLALSGQVRVDPDLMHEEEEVEESHPDDEAELKAVLGVGTRPRTGGGA
jgi:TRAP-type C4-dicarboxylate transport system permease small subunit